MSWLGQKNIRVNRALISRLLEVKNPSTNTDLIDADENLNKVEIGGEFSTSRSNHYH